MAFLFHKKDKKEEDPEVLAAYKASLKKRRIQNAEAAGIRDADKLANRKPLYQKVAGAGKFLLNDLSEGAMKTNPDALFTFNNSKDMFPFKNPQQQRKRRKRRH